MKRITYIILGLLALPLYGQAQGQEQTEFAGRASVTADWKIVKGLHLNAEYEIRSEDAFKGVERNQFGIGVSYKINGWLRVAGGYDYIGRFNSERELKPRHRGYLDVIGTLNLGYWRLSLKERLQLTHKSFEMNTFQAPVNDLGLKSKLKLSYRGFQTIEPYAFAELRHDLNAASYNAEFNPEKGKYVNYEFTGYKCAYVDRLRMSAGLVWTISKHHEIDFGFMADRIYGRKLDVNSEGTKLKSVIWDNYWALGLAVGYAFSF